ncbi:Trypsin-like serine protease [Gryllus bimaculatus]|nr:Trypsin-like serine protease [Gryllus bimaculatus]
MYDTTSHAGTLVWSLELLMGDTWGSMLLLAAAAAVLALCDLQQHVAVGTYYDIASPNYPQSYTAGTQCRWRATADAGAQLKLSCGVFQLPAVSLRHAA